MIENFLYIPIFSTSFKNCVMIYWNLYGQNQLLKSLLPLRKIYFIVQFFKKWILHVEIMYLSIPNFLHLYKTSLIFLFSITNVQILKCTNLFVFFVILLIYISEPFSDFFKKVSLNHHC